MYVLLFQDQYHEEADHDPPMDPVLLQPSMQSCCTKLSSYLAKFFHKKHLGLNVFILWTVFCIPGIIVTLVLLQTQEHVIDLEDQDYNEEPENQSHFTCHEVKNDWEQSRANSQFGIQGVAILAIGIPGFIGNLLSIVVLLQCKDNRNFHRLLAGLAIVDMLNLLDLIVEVAIIGEFLKEEPEWFRIIYPFFIHPFRGIIQTACIFMVVAVATERYRYVLPNFAFECKIRQVGNFEISLSKTHSR